MREAIEDVEKGRYVDPSDRTVAEFIAEWLEFKKLNASATTVQRYTDEMNLYVLPRIGGLKLQTYVAAPTGTPVTALEHRAIWASIEAESSLSESLSAMVRMDLVSVLGVGDRVHVSIDDGPSQIDTLWRVVGKTVESSAAAFSVELSPWVEGPP